MKYVLFLVFMLKFLSGWGQNKSEERFFTWEQFTQNFGNEMAGAYDVFQAMRKTGLHDFSLAQFDFHFYSNTKDKLEKLQAFLEAHYPYEIESIKHIRKGFWELNGVSNELPVTEENLLYWALDMYKRGYEFDAKLDGYGAPIDAKNEKFPDFDKSKEESYFDKGIVCYNAGNLSGAILNWTLCIQINPNDPNYYYSRAIVKNELYTWKAALRDYDKAIEIAPEFTSALINRGGLKDENGDYEGAIEDYNKVLQMENVDLEHTQQAYYNKGNTMFNMGNKEDACELWKKAHALGAEYALERIQERCN